MTTSNYSNKNDRLNLDKHFASTNQDFDYDEDEEFYVIGDRVLLDNSKLASVAYFGETDFDQSGCNDWVGLVLDEPIGNHDGKYHGREYFQCAKNHGLFVRPNRLQRCLPGEDSAFGSSATSSRQATPQPHSSLISGRSTATSSTASYFYDDDYRLANSSPSVAALERKLKSIELKNNKFNGKMSSSISSNELRDNNSISSRVNELNRRLTDAAAAAKTTTTTPQRPSQYNRLVQPVVESVFNFRPKREQYYGTEERRGSGNKSVSLSPFKEPPRKGERVKVKLNNSNETQLTGVLRFMGETEFATGEWAGVELDEPVGKNDGSVLGHRYFYCPNNYGLFVPAMRVKKLTDIDDDNDCQARQYSDVKTQFDNLYNNHFATMPRSTIKSPPPKVITSTRDGRLYYWKGGSRSTTPNCTDELMSNYQPSSLSSSSSPSSPLITGNNSPSYTARPMSANSTASSLFSSPLSIRAETPMSSSSLTPVSPYGCERTNRKLLRESEDILAPLRSSSLYIDSRPAKFDDRDIERELKKSLQKQTTSSTTSSGWPKQAAKPKAVQYTFISSKYDGNPIARKTLVYE